MFYIEELVKKDYVIECKSGFYINTPYKLWKFVYTQSKVSSNYIIKGNVASA